MSEGMNGARRSWLAQCTALIVAGLGAGSCAWSAESRTLLVVGDSLSAEYGLERGTGWVALLGRRLAAEAPGWHVVNASISGDTTAGGTSRLLPLLKQYKPALVIIELGGNDALRGLPLESTRTNLTTMSDAVKASGARLLIAGIQLPPNYGHKYGDQFAALFADVATHEHAALVPFILKGVADVPNAESLFQADRIHPLASAHPTILANVWPVVRPLLK